MGRKALTGLLLVVAIGLAFYFKPVKPVPDPKHPEEKKILSEDEKTVRAAIHCLPVLPGHAQLAWGPLWVIGEKKADSLEKMARENPLEFLEHCLSRYERNVESYRVIFLKQERVLGELKKPEKIRVHFREKPFSVHMDWLEGAGLACMTLYVEGENEGKVLALPILKFLGIKSVDVDGDLAKKTSRYGINKFGMGVGIRSCLESMRAADKAKTLHLKYEGMVALANIGGRACYKLVRKPYTPPEDDGVAEITLYIDAETLLQVGSVLRNDLGELIAEYFFRDTEINPTMGSDQFTRKALK